jgi:4,5-dihydroxyphthalate decarboxylase
MGNLPVTLATRDYDYVVPLALGDVTVEGIDLTVIREFGALPRVLQDPAVHGGEASFSRHVQRLAAGDRSFVAVPAFLMREFRHRNFFVHRDAGLRAMGDLKGTRIGMDAWPNSGNTWSRALLRADGVGLDAVRWIVGPINPGDAGPRPDALPGGVEAAPAGRSLQEMLLARELDVLIAAWPPAGFGERGSPIVRLYPDFRAVERDDYRKTKLYPAHHIVVVRRRLVEEHPWAVRSLYAALLRAREHAARTRRLLHESSAWLLADLEEEAEVLGPGFEPYGVRGNRAMIAAFCEEQWAQGLVPRRLDPSEIFADFERLAALEPGGRPAGGAT